MNDPFLVRVVHGFAHLREQAQPFLNRKLMIVAILIDGAAFDVIHHQVRQSFGRAAAIQQLDDVGMIEASQRLPLCSEPAQHLVGVRSWRYQLDSDLLAEFAIRALGQEHRGHAALSHAPHQLVDIQLAAGHGIVVFAEGDGA